MRVNKGEKGLVVVERVFNAPQDCVWKAIADNEQVKKWLFEFEGFQAKKGVEFQFTVVHKGFKYVHLCKVTEIIINRKLSYSWRYQGHTGDSLVTFELFSEGPKTMLRLTHCGLDTFPAIPGFAIKNFKIGWGALIGQKLKEYIQALSKREVLVSKLIDAPVKHVWKAFADTKQIEQWWGPNGFTTTTVRREFKVGGIWKHTMHGPDGTDYPNQSKFIEIVPYERIVYIHGGSKKGGPGANFISYWTFETLDAKTRVTIRLVFANQKDRDTVVKVYRAVEGGKQTLGRLAKFLN